MLVSERAIEIAREYLGMTEVTENSAPWLTSLMEKSGNPCHWSSPQPYCISAACACYAIAYQEVGMVFPKEFASASTQLFYDKALAGSITAPIPRVGSIVIFKLGTQYHGHAGIVTRIYADGIDTVEFNTSSGAGGNQRNGEGVYEKHRAFAKFQKSDTGLWIRGYVVLPDVKENDLLASGFDATRLVTAI